MSTIQNMEQIQRVTTSSNRWDREEQSVTVVHEEGDYTTPDGFFHRGGVHRVTAFNTMSGKAYQGKVYKGRAKTFKGESAWMNAERLFDDIISEVRYSK